MVFRKYDPVYKSLFDIEERMSGNSGTRGGCKYLKDIKVLTPPRKGVPDGGPIWPLRVIPVATGPSSESMVLIIPQLGDAQLGHRRCLRTFEFLFRSTSAASRR